MKENIHQGNLEIRSAADAEKYRSITKVTGYLSIHSSAKLDAPALTSVGGYLYIYSNAKLDALTSVGGHLYIHSNAKLDAPALTSVGGHLYIYSNAKLDAPALTSVGGYLSIYSNGALTAGRLYSGGFDKFKVIDGIGCVALSEKKQGDLTILMCRHSKIKNRKVVGDKFYVASKGNDNAHGKTIADATQELMFKIGPRDVEKYRAMPIDTAKSPTEWALIYRTVTGACQYGTGQFIAARGKLKKKYTLAEILALTKGQWGHDKFAATVAPMRAAA
jgi:hypothetical protein